MADAPYPLRPTDASPVVLVSNGATSFSFDTTNASTSWKQAIGENLSRKEGVWVQCTHASAKILVVRPADSDPGTGTKIGFKVKASYTSATAVDNDDVLHIPGTGAVWVKDFDENTAVSYSVWER